MNEREYESEGAPAPQEPAGNDPSAARQSVPEGSLSHELSSAPLSSAEEQPSEGGSSQAMADAHADSGVSAAEGSRNAEAIREDIVEVLKTVYDPEIPVDIFELGLIYTVDVKDDRHVHVEMTLTSPACPVAGTLPPEVEEKVRGVVGVKDATVEVVWDPPWNPGMMSESARLELGFMM